MCVGDVPEMMTSMNKCPLCQRDLPAELEDNHHLIPKTFKGKRSADNIVSLHRVCHRKIHSVFTERELLHTYNTIESILSDPDIQSFVKWIHKKPADYYISIKDTNTRRHKRRR
jgi:hypothetical protein